MWSLTSRWTAFWRILNGIRGSFLKWSVGRPKRYLGMIHAPRRAARNVRVGDVGGLHRDVHRRVAHAEHDDVLALEDRGLDVLVGVQLRAGEAVCAREGRLGPARVPVVAVGDEDDVVLAHLAVVGLDRVDAVGAARHRLHARVEEDVVAEAEVVDVGVEVRGDLRVMRVVGVVGRHREVRVGHAVARGVDVQVAVGGRRAVAVA